MLRKPELGQRDSGEYIKFCRHFRIPYEFLELVQLAKHRKWFSLATRNVTGRQCIVVLWKDNRRNFAGLGSRGLRAQTKDRIVLQ